MRDAQAYGFTIKEKLLWGWNMRTIVTHLDMAELTES